MHWMQTPEIDDHGHDLFQQMNVEVLQQIFREEIEAYNLGYTFRDLCCIVHEIITKKSSKYFGVLKSKLPVSDEFFITIAHIYLYRLREYASKHKKQLKKQTHKKFFLFYKNHIRAIRRYLKTINKGS